MNQNQPIPVDGEQPVLNDKEIKFRVNVGGMPSTVSGFST